MVQSNLDYPDIDYPDFAIIRTINQSHSLSVEKLSYAELRYKIPVRTEFVSHKKTI